jgi:hypothetical protein
MRSVNRSDTKLSPPLFCVTVIRMNHKFILWLGALLATQPLLASLMTPLSIDDLTAKAALIVRGTVLSKSSQRDAGGRIYTKVELNVAEVWKGSHTAKHLVIVHGGGTLGEERVVVSNQVEYDIAEEVVAFCVLNQRGEAVTLGLCQGKFHVWKDDAGMARVRNPFHGAGNSPSETRSLQNPERSKSDGLTLDQLKERVQGKGSTQ